MIALRAPVATNRTHDVDLKVFNNCDTGRAGRRARVRPSEPSAVIVALAACVWKVIRVFKTLQLRDLAHFLAGAGTRARFALCPSEKKKRCAALVLPAFALSLFLNGFYFKRRTCPVLSLWKQINATTHFSASLRVAFFYFFWRDTPTPEQCGCLCV